MPRDKRPEITDTTYEAIALRTLRLTHQEVARYGGLMSDHGMQKTNRRNVITATLEYGASFRLKRKFVVKVLDQVKERRGFGKFKNL